MWEDPIVAEVHRTREKLAAQYNYDLKAFFADLRKRQVALGERLVDRRKNVPRDEWERGLLDAAKDCGVSPPDSALSSEGLYD